MRFFMLHGTHHHNVTTLGRLGRFPSIHGGGKGSLPMEQTFTLPPCPLPSMEGLEGPFHPPHSPQEGSTSGAGGKGGT